MGVAVDEARTEHHAPEGLGQLREDAPAGELRLGRAGGDAARPITFEGREKMSEGEST